jgi:tetratricopeptide (TPR) repeat protein
MGTSQAEVMRLIGTLPHREPAAGQPWVLQGLFGQLPVVAETLESQAIEDQIWDAWMYHPNARAARALDASVADIAAQRLDIAETRLVRLLRARPDYAEAWNKLATVYYLRGWDEACIKAICHTLVLEPRHFGALAELGEVFLAAGQPEEALLAFRAAIRIHPRSEAVLQRLKELTEG